LDEACGTHKPYVGGCPGGVGGAGRGTARQAEAAASNEKMLFVSDRTTGKGVNNPTGDYEIFSMNANGTAVRQLTFNEIFDSRPLLSPDGTKVLYQSQGAQPSNPEHDQEVYVMNSSDGSGQINLTDNRGILNERHAQFSPDGRKIAYTSEGEQESNPQADQDIYVMNALDGSGKTNLSNNGADVYEESPSFSPDGQKIAYTSFGTQPSNPEADRWWRHRRARRTPWGGDPFPGTDEELKETRMRETAQDVAGRTSSEHGKK
jgi:Tol biopolymer transport system component